MRSLAFSRLVLICWFVILPLAESLPQDSTRWRVDGGLFFSTFQQQVKAKVGDPRGERLVNLTDIGIFLAGTYAVHPNVAVGAFLQFDRGNRHASRFDGFDAQGRTKTTNKVGGDFQELWAGPLLRASWRQLFVEGGYGLLGSRTDDARTDLVSSTGDTLAAFRLLPSIAWYASAGGVMTVAHNLDVVFRLEYRLRYYHERGGQPLQNDIDHGSQNISPFIGIAWRF